MNFDDHLVVLPIVLPLAAGAAMLLLDERRHLLKAVMAVASVLVLIGIALALLRTVDSQPVRVYALGGWPARFRAASRPR